MLEIRPRTVEYSHGQVESLWLNRNQVHDVEEVGGGEEKSPRGREGGGMGCSAQARTSEVGETAVGMNDAMERETKTKQKQKQKHFLSLERSLSLHLP